MFNTLKRASTFKSAAKPAAPPAQPQFTSPMSAIGPDNRFSTASSATVSTSRSSIFSNTHSQDRYSRRSSASTVQSTNVTEEETALELALQRKAQYERSVQEKEFRLVQTHFISQVLTFLGCPEHAMGGTVAMALHDIDMVVRPHFKGAANSYEAEVVNVPDVIDVLLELAGVGSKTIGSVNTATVGVLAYNLKRMFVERFPAWFYLDEDSLSGKLYFHDPANILNATFAAGDAEDGFLEVIKFAAEHPPPPPEPREEPKETDGMSFDDGNTATSTPTNSTPSEDDFLRKPIEINIHIVAHPNSPYRWLQYISLGGYNRHTTTTMIRHKHHHRASSNALTLQTPTLSLPALLVAKLCTSNIHLRSIQMTDRKQGFKELREAVAISRYMQAKCIRTPASMEIPEEAFRMLERLRGPRGKEEKDLLTWVLRGNKGQRMQLTVEIPNATGTITLKNNKELRELTLVRRHTMGLPGLSAAGGGGGSVSAQTTPRIPNQTFTPLQPQNNRLSLPVMMSHQPPPVDAFAMAAMSSNRGMGSGMASIRSSSSPGTSMLDGLEGHHRLSGDRGRVSEEYLRLEVPRRGDVEIGSISEDGGEDDAAAAMAPPPALIQVPTKPVTAATNLAAAEEKASNRRSVSWGSLKMPRWSLGGGASS